MPTLTVIRAPHGFRNVELDDNSTAFQQESFYSGCKEIDLNAVPLYISRDSYWLMQQQAKQQLLLGKDVILIGEYPNMETLVGLGKTARSYHAKLKIITLDYDDDVEHGTVSQGYDTSSIRLSIAHFHKDIDAVDVINTSRAKDEEHWRKKNAKNSR